MFLAKYNTARHFYIPVIKRGVQDYAVGADWTPAGGDVKISLDGAAASNIGTLPSAITMGNTAMWDFSLTGGELSAKQVMVSVSDSATKAVEDQFFIIETYGNASALHAFDLNTATQSVNVSQFGGSNGTFASGRPEVNTTHIAGSAVSTSTAQIGVNVVQLNADATAAVNISKTTRAIGRGTVTTGAGTTSIPTSSFTPNGAVADQFKGRIITFDANTSTAALQGQSTDITASTNAANPTFTVTALTTAPANGDTFSVT